MDEICNQFQGKGFDGMTDSTIYYRTALADGRESGLGLILTQRSISPTLARKAAALVAEFYGVEAPEVVETGGQFVTWQLKRDFCPREDIREYWSTLIHRAAADRSQYVSTL